MLAFTLTVDQLELFYELCEAAHAETEEQKMVILEEMARVGQITNVVKTKMGKEEYIEHLAKNFGNVLVVKPGESQNGDSTHIGFDTEF